LQKQKAVEEELHAFLNSTVGGGELNRRPGRPHSKSEGLEEGEVPYPA